MIQLLEDLESRVGPFILVILYIYIYILFFILLLNSNHNTMGGAFIVCVCVCMQTHKKFCFKQLHPICNTCPLLIPYKSPSEKRSHEGSLYLLFVVSAPIKRGRHCSQKSGKKIIFFLKQCGCK